MCVYRSDGLQEHHRWLLHVYENVYEGTLKSLLRNGLIELIHEHFKKELEDCDYIILKRKIMSLDVDICKVHGDHCHFVPTYRCDSPSYQQVCKNMGFLTNIFNLVRYNFNILLSNFCIGARRNEKLYQGQRFNVQDGYRLWFVRH